MSALLPGISDIPAKSTMITGFLGYHHGPRIAENECFDMKNLSSDLYPLISPRKPREKIAMLSKPNGLFANEKLCWVDGKDFYYDGEKKATLSDSKKQFVNMGGRILIFPDKVAFDIKSGRMESLENTVTVSGVTAALCERSGAEISATASKTPPKNPTDGMYWIDTGGQEDVLKIYSAAFYLWQEVPTVYVKLSAKGIGAGFSQFDGVTVSGMKGEALNGNFFLEKVGQDYLVIPALIRAGETQTASVTIKRAVPDMDFVVELSNRIWGCSSKNREIYACALSDPKNWNRYLGIASDSYALSVGSGGSFTGAAAHLGYVLFFKEDRILKVFGDKPQNFQLSETLCRGVEAGSEDSLVTLNETLYFKGKEGVMAYRGAFPSGVSEVFGKVRYKNAASGAAHGKYYLSMEEENSRAAFFVYDEEKNLWHKEDDTRALAFAKAGGELYFIEKNGGLYRIDSGDERVEWMFETGEIGLDLSGSKYIGKIGARVRVDAGAEFCLAVQYDGEETWQEVYRIAMTSVRSFTVPFLPKRCDTMRLRFFGKGGFALYSLSKTVEEGSDV